MAFFLAIIIKIWYNNALVSGGNIMKDIDLENLDDESLLELLGALNGMNDEINRMEYEENE